MKKILTYAVSLVVAFACIMSLSACNLGKLKAPSGLSVNEDTWTFTWEAVENADSYIIDFEGKMIPVKDTQYDISGLIKQLRDYSLKVQAVPAEGSDLKASDWSVLNLTVSTLPVIKPEVVPSKNLSFSLTEDGSGYAVSLGTCRDKEIIIPDTYEGKPVTEIAYLGFYGGEEGNTTITKVTIPESVKVIGEGAFANCLKLLRVVVKGENLETIGRMAFLNNLLLTNVTMPKSLTTIEEGAFQGAILIKNVTFPDSLTTLGVSAYAGCTGLSEVTFGKGLKDVPEKAFYGCTALKTINWGHYVENIASQAFTQTQVVKITFPESIKTIGEQAFVSNTLLKTIVLNEGLESVGAGAFADNINVKDITFPESLDYIGDQAFANCGEIRTVNLKYIKEIGSGVFAQCKRLTTVNALEGAEAIGASMFANCEKLDTINFASTVKDIGNGAFKACVSLKTVTFPDGIVRVGMQAFSGCTSLATINIPDTVKDIGYKCFDGTAWDEANQEGYIYFDNFLYGYKGTLTKTVIDDIKPGTTGIGASAFATTNITSIVIPEGVTSISENAFNGCAKLASVTLPSTLDYIGAAAFYSCTSLPTITIPEGVETIMTSAFGGCTKLSEVNLPSSLKTIGAAAFEKCTSLKNITLPSGLLEMGSKAFASSAITEIVIPEGVKTLASELFSGCVGLESVTLPSKLETIGASAFYGCTAIAKFEIPETVSLFGEAAFAGCSRLADINLPKNLKALSKQMFAACTSLANIDIPASVSSIAAYAFQGCTALKTVTFPEAVTVLTEGVFYKSGITSFTINASVVTMELGVFHSSAIESIVVPATVKNFGESIFANCAKLTDAVIRASLKELPYGTFYGCASLTDVTLPDTITVIKGYYSQEVGETSIAFGKCTALVTIKLPSSLVILEDYAFYNCTSLKSIEIPATVKTIGNAVFHGCKALATIVMPETIESAGAGVLDGSKWYSDLANGPVYLGNVLFGYKGDMPNGYIIRDIPENITVIADQAFAKSMLFGAIIPGNIKYIGNYAFALCGQLSFVYLSKDVDTINAFTFLSSTKVAVYTDAVKHDAKNVHNNWSLDAFYTVVTDDEGNESKVILNTFYDCEFAENYEYVLSISRSGAKLNTDYAFDPPFRTGYSFGGWSLTEGAESHDYLYNEVSKIPSGKRVYSVWAR